MSGSKCCFLTCIQVSQKTGKVVWNSYIFKNFPVCCDPHSQRLSGSQWSRSMFFWNFFAFSMIQQMLANWPLVPLSFQNPACTYGGSQFTYCWSLLWRILNITLLACEMNTVVQVVWTSFSTSLLWDWSENWLLSTGWVFQICWHIECSTLTASSFRILNNSAGILSSPLALFVVMLTKAHLTSNSKMSSSRWVTTPSWLSRSLRLFLYQFNHSAMSDSLWPHGLQHSRPPCPSPTPRVYSDSCPLSRWCHSTISSSVVPFSSRLQSFPASGSFPVSQLFTSGGPSIGVSASASVLPMNTQDWSPLEWTGWISLQSKGLSRFFSNTTVQRHQFCAQLSS